jgi:hypothetical protein
MVFKSINFNQYPLTVNKAEPFASALEFQKAQELNLANLTTHSEDPLAEEELGLLRCLIISLYGYGL